MFNSNRYIIISEFNNIFFLIVNYKNSQSLKYFFIINLLNLNNNCQRKKMRRI